MDSNVDVKEKPEVSNSRERLARSISISAPASARKGKETPLRVVLA